MALHAHEELTESGLPALAERGGGVCARERRFACGGRHVCARIAMV